MRPRAEEETFNRRAAGIIPLAFSSPSAGCYQCTTGRAPSHPGFLEQLKAGKVLSLQHIFQQEFGDFPAIELAEQAWRAFCSRFSLGQRPSVQQGHRPRMPMPLEPPKLEAAPHLLLSLPLVFNSPRVSRLCAPCRGTCWTCWFLPLTLLGANVCQALSNFNDPKPIHRISVWILGR